MSIAARFRSRPVFLALAAIIATAVPAAAQPAPPVSADEAARIEVVLRDWISTQLSGRSGAGLSVPLTVAAASDRYLARLPAGSIRIGAEGSPTAATVTFTAAEMTLTPEAGRTWRAEWTVPASLTFDGPGAARFSIEIGGQHGRAQYSEALRGVSAIDTEWRGVAVTTQGGPGAALTIDLGRVALSGENRSPAGAGRGDAAMEASLDGLEAVIAGPRLVTAVDIGRLSAAISVAGIDLPALLDFMMPAIGLDAVGGPDRLRALADGVAPIARDIRGFTFDGSLADLTLTETWRDSARSNGNTSHSVAQGRLGFAMSATPGTQLRLTGGMTDLVSLEPGYFRPSFVDVDVTLDQLPQAVLSRSVRRFLEEAAQHRLDRAATVTIFEAVSELSEGRGRLRIDRLQLDFAQSQFGVDVSGAIAADAAGPYGLTGTVLAVVSAPDALFRPMTAPDPQIRSVLVEAGRPAPNLFGREARSYEIRLGPGQAVTINGTGIEALMGGE